MKGEEKITPSPLYFIGLIFRHIGEYFSPLLMDFCVVTSRRSKLVTIRRSPART